MHFFLSFFSFFSFFFLSFSVMLTTTTTTSNFFFFLWPQPHQKALVMLERIIGVFLPDIFVMDNHLALQERLLGLHHILSFLDPILSNHLTNIGVTPNLYAISWFLTMFAHVLPMNLVYEVWDVLLSLSCLDSLSSRAANSSTSTRSACGACGVA